MWQLARKETFREAAGCVWTQFPHTEYQEELLMMFNAKTQQLLGKAGKKHTGQFNNPAESLHKVCGSLADTEGWFGPGNRWVSGGVSPKTHTHTQTFQFYISQQHHVGAGRRLQAKHEARIQKKISRRRQKPGLFTGNQTRQVGQRLAGSATRNQSRLQYCRVFHELLKNNLAMNICEAGVCILGWTGGWSWLKEVETAGWLGRQKWTGDQ